MSVFDYHQFGDPMELSVNPHKSNCHYCNGKLQYVSIEKDLWPVSDSDLLVIHESTKAGYKEIHDLEDCYLNLDFDKKSTDVYLSYCGICGWWTFIKEISISAEAWQIWDFFFGYTGVLRNLDLSDISIPINEVSKFLLTKYERRFSVHPRIFEEVVAHVFREAGYYAHVTGYSHDGGIDVVLGNAQEQFIGVQVKRYRGKIKAEQIRAFAGSLMLSGLPSGIFVTTSDFQPGAIQSASAYSAKTLPIALINADSFYDALKVTQKQEVDLKQIYKLITEMGANKPFFYGWETHANSL